ncbi:MAG: hypothetical protein RL757_2676 [Bacteroidota bacterium]|jgi:hypothetical protein
MDIPQPFRIFYNTTIHPALMRLESERKQLWRWIFIAAIVAILLFIVFTVVAVPMLWYFYGLGLVGFFVWWSGKVTAFKLHFKPNIVNLVIDYIDNASNIGTLEYKVNASISKKTFQQSRLFNSAMPEFVGEDYITGTIGELAFEMSELSVMNFSDVRLRLDTVFSGVFLHATFRHDRNADLIINKKDIVRRELPGDIIIFPRVRKPQMTPTIKAFTRELGWEVVEGKNAAFSGKFVKGFKELFCVYAMRHARPENFLTDEMQKALVAYHEKTQKEMHLSLRGQDVFIAVEQQKDLLEPTIWRSNTSFELIREFYNDIQLLLEIVLDVDANN